MNGDDDDNNNNSNTANHGGELLCCLNTMETERHARNALQYTKKRTV